MKSTIKLLFRYVKNNPFLISLASFALCGLAYLYQVLELRKWEIPLGVADGMMAQYLFTVVLGLFYFFSAAYLQEYIRVKFYYYVPIRLANKKMEQLVEKMKRLFPKKIKGDTEKRIEEIEQKCKKVKYGIIKTIISAVLVGAICFLPIYAMFFILILDSNWLMVLALFAPTMVVMIISAYTAIARSAKKEIGYIEDKSIGDGTFEDYLSACNEIINYELTRLEKKELKERDDDNDNYFLVTVIAFIMFAFGMLVNLCSGPPKEYWIYVAENGDSYASVFEAADTFVLKRAVIEGNSIRLFLNEQIIVDGGETIFKYYTFESVSVEG